jgi:BCCT family betaine/carnitine transporter
MVKNHMVVIICGYILLVTLLMQIIPESFISYLDMTRNWLLTKLDFLYFSLVLFALGIAIYILVSPKFRALVYKKTDTTCEFKETSWAYMLFAGGMGSSLMYWSFAEWALYYYNAPFLAEPKTPLAMEWGAALALFHWSIPAWLLYSLTALPIACILFFEKRPTMRFSDGLEPYVSDKHVNFLSFIDVCFVIGLMGGATTTLILGTPFLSALIKEIVPNVGMYLADNQLNVIVLSITMVLFTYSAYQGLEDGIEKFSTWNVYLYLFVMLAFMFTDAWSFIIRTMFSSVGRMINYMPMMLTWLDPIQVSQIPQQSTSFNWAWWLVYAPFMGVFIARISRGRSLAHMFLGTVFYGTLGSILAFSVMGGYAMHAEVTGKLNFAELVNTAGPITANIALLNTLPFAKFWMFMILIVGIIFLVTTYDSATFVIATSLMKTIQADEEPPKKVKIFSALAIGAIPLLFLVHGATQLSIIQSLTILGVIPTIVAIIIVWLIFVMVILPQNVPTPFKKFISNFEKVAAFTQKIKIFTRKKQGELEQSIIASDEKAEAEAQKDKEE